MQSVGNSINNAGVKKSAVYYGSFSGKNNDAQTSPDTPPISPAQKTIELRENLAKESKKNGLIEKFYDYCKNKTGFGVGSKKIKRKIDKFEQGKADEKDIKKDLYNYRTSQKNTEQNLGNLASGFVGLAGFFGVFNIAKLSKAQFDAKATSQLFEVIELLAFLPKNKKVAVKKALTSKTKMTAIALPFIMIASGLTKWALLKINSIGSKEFVFKHDKKLDKKENIKLKRKLIKEKHKSGFRNFYTGAANALFAPIASIYGGIIGVPAYILATSGFSFLENKKDNKNNSLDGYTTVLKNSAVASSLFAAALAVPALKKARYSDVLSKNLEKVVKKLKDVKLKEPNFRSTKTAYSELEDLMLDSPKIKSILENHKLSPDQKIIKLIKENLFAAKFLQISKRGEEITSMLIENCPPSRTTPEAQAEINRLLKANYKVSKLLGVGTVAESYLAKDPSGREVCIKILKKGIDAAKIKQDKEDFIKMVTKGKSPKDLTKAQEYLVRNIENMAEALLKEIDFENEMAAAQKLKKATKKADVVVPIKAKPGIYVMEKAPGISLDTLVKYYQYESILKDLRKAKPINDAHAEYINSLIFEYSQKMRSLKAKSPDFKDFDLSANEINQLLMKYIEVLVEQFTKIDKNGKTLHADIHPGNIFINLEALKTKKGKLFTLIDTGNTIDLTKEQAIASLKLTGFIQNGNVKDITKYVLNGAILPKGMSQEKAFSLVEQDLRKIFFDGKTKCGIMDMDNLLKLTNNILREHDIIPNDTQLNLNKANISAQNSLFGLVDTFARKKYADINKKKNSKKVALTLTKDVGLIAAKFLQANKLQESKNLFQMSPTEIIKMYRNPNNIRTNSEEYLTFEFKQSINQALQYE